MEMIDAVDGNEVGPGSNYNKPLRHPDDSALLPYRYHKWSVPIVESGSNQREQNEALIQDVRYNRTEYKR